VALAAPAAAAPDEPLEVPALLAPIGELLGEPAPSADANVPAGASVDAGVPSPQAPAGAAPAPVPVPEPLAGAVPTRRIARAHASADACIAVALLTGRAPRGCDVPGGRSPSLSEAVAHVGVCVRLALLTGTPTTACGSPATDRAPLVANALSRLASDSRLCLAARQLDSAGLEPCSALSAVTNSSTDARSDENGAASHRQDLCLGLAVLSARDPQRCLGSAAEAPVGASGDDVDDDDGDAGAAGDGTSGAVGANGAEVGADGAAVASGAAAPSGDGGGTLPFTGASSLALGSVGAALTGAGCALRRFRRARAC
jgi:hypothetical protein